MSLVSKYKQHVQINHGWEIELHCPQCNSNDVPAFEDGTIDTKRIHKNTADIPMLCAAVTCSGCGHDLEEQAGEKLTELFSQTPKTLGWPSILMGVLFFLPVLMFGIIGVGVFVGWWDGLELWHLGAVALCYIIFLIGHYLVHPMMYSCKCGDPKFLLMGALGRSYCFRCSTCSRLLRRGR